MGEQHTLNESVVEVTYGKAKGLKGIVSAQGTNIYFSRWSLFKYRLWPNWFWNLVPKRWKKDPLANIGTRTINNSKAMKFYKYNKTKVRL